LIRGSLSFIRGYFLHFSLRFDLFLYFQLIAEGQMPPSAIFLRFASISVERKSAFEKYAYLFLRRSVINLNKRGVSEKIPVFSDKREVLSHAVFRK